jgi:hypothetical protein
MNGNEEWRPVPGPLGELYEVSNLANFRTSSTHQRILTHQAGKNRAIAVKLKEPDGTVYTRGVAKMVAEVFLNITGRQLFFRDGNRTNCSADNLSCNQVRVRKYEHSMSVKDVTEQIWKEMLSPETLNALQMRT